MGDYHATKSIVDRLKNNAYTVEIEGKASMRKHCTGEKLETYTQRQNEN